MSDMNTSNDNFHLSHIDIPRAPYAANFASLGFPHRAFACAHDLYSRVLHKPWEKLTAAIDSFFRQPQLFVFPEISWSETISFDPPQSHAQNHLTRLPLSFDRLITVSLPYLLPVRSLSLISTPEDKRTQVLYHG